jgi:hypothetical protein
MAFEILLVRFRSAPCEVDEVHFASTGVEISHSTKKDVRNAKKPPAGSED